MRNIFAPLLVVSLLFVSTAAQQRKARPLSEEDLFKSEALLRPYFELVRAYRRRDPAPLQTLKDASLWPRDRLQKTVDLLRAIQPNIYDPDPRTPRPVDWKPIILRAAVMLHTEVTLDSLDEALATSAGTHREMAVTIAKLLEGPSDRSFAHRWFVTSSTLLRWHNRPVETLTHVNEGVAQFPNAPDLLLLAGTLQEDIARADRNIYAWPMSRGDRLGEAERAFRRALAVDAALEEAHVHLGRVLHLLDRRAEASMELAPVAERSRNRVLRYLAHLFLGGIYEDESRWADAERAYRAAMEFQPRDQTADIALSALLDRLGRRPEASEILMGTLKKGPRPDFDPWWTYVFGPSQDLLWPRFLSLREEVME